MDNITYDTPELRARLDALSKECVDLHVPPPPVTWVNLKVEDGDGNIVHEHVEKANSWVRNFYNIMALTFLPSSAPATYGAGSLGVKESDGSVKSATGSGNYVQSTASSWGFLANNSNAGIQVGTGVGAESFDSHKLDSLIATGSGTGQLVYQAGSVGTASYNTGAKKWTQTISRVFNNNSAAGITVTETAIIVNTSGSTYVMYDRSLLATPVTVPPANKLTVTYTTEMTFPA